MPSQEREAPPFDRVEDLIGCVRGGPPDLSEETGKRFRQLLASRKGRDFLLYRPEGVAHFQILP